MKTISFLLLLLISVACNNSDVIKPGLYTTTNYTKLEVLLYRFTKGVDLFIVGDSLYLNADSAFKSTSCGSISEGKWRVSHNTLTLISDTTYFKYTHPSDEHGLVHLVSKPPIITYTISENSVMNISTFRGSTVLMKLQYRGK